jgi:hypothetical protein
MKRISKKKKSIHNFPRKYAEKLISEIVFMGVSTELSAQAFHRRLFPYYSGAVAGRS